MAENNEEREYGGLGEEGRTGSVMAERREREAEKHWRRERKSGEMNKVDPITVIN